MKVIVRKNDHATRSERWEVAWDGEGPQNRIAGLPTERRAWGFADLVTALRPLDDDISDLKRRADSHEHRLEELEGEAIHLEETLLHRIRELGLDLSDKQK